MTHWTEAINSVPLTLTSLSSGKAGCPGFQTILQHLASGAMVIRALIDTNTKMASCRQRYAPQVRQVFLFFSSSVLPLHSVSAHTLVVLEHASLYSVYIGNGAFSLIIYSVFFLTAPTQAVKKTTLYIVSFSGIASNINCVVC